MKQETILVVGASGTIGSELVRLLKAEGHNVRETTSRRDQTTKAYLDVRTGEGIKAAFEGIERAFLLSPAGFADQQKVLSPLIQEAKRRGLKKVVLMTAMGVNANEESPLRKAEVELEKSGLNYNILRPNWFMQNFNTFWLETILKQNKILLPAGQAKTSFIDGRDISAVAAKLLTTEAFANRAFDLTGSEALDHDEVASLIAKASGKPVKYEEITPEAFKAGLVGAGLPEDYANVMLMIISFLREGYAARVEPSVKEILGREPLKFERYANDFKKAWA